MKPDRPDELHIADRLNIVGVVGLDPPPESALHPFFWNQAGHSKPPGICRWIWHPQTGEMRIGPRYHHYMLLPGGRPMDIQPWVRGFVLRCLLATPGKPAIAIRPYFCPARDEEWDERHAAINDRIFARLEPLLQAATPGWPIHRDVGDAWLRQSTGVFTW